MKKILGGIMTFLLAIVFALSMLSLSFSVLLTPWPTHVFASIFVEEGSAGPTHDELVATADGIRAYCMGDDSVSLPSGTDTTTAITATDLSHLQDVRMLFERILLLAAISTLAAIILGIICRLVGKKRLLGNALYVAAFLVAILVIVSVGFAVTDFLSFFNVLHSFFFTSNSWFFPANSLMIRSLPTPFWVAMGILWSVLIVILCCVASSIARRLRKHSR